MDTLLEQLKRRRRELALKQHDMMQRIGMSRQQYQRLESKGNPRLNTLELVARGLNGALLFIPQEKLHTVLAVLDGDSAESNPLSKNKTGEETNEKHSSLVDDPWLGLLEDNE